MKILIRFLLLYFISVYLFIYMCCVDMFVCFFLFAEELLKGTYNGGTVFYRKDQSAIASAQGESEAKGYIAHLTDQVENLSVPLAVGQFSVSSRKEVDRGVLLTCSMNGADREKYKIFISNRNSTNITDADLRYFVNLFNNKHTIRPVTFPSAPSSPARTPQRTAETQTSKNDQKLSPENGSVLVGIEAEEQVRIQEELAAIKIKLASMMTASPSPFKHPNQIKQIIQYLEDDLVSERPAQVLFFLRRIAENPKIDIEGYDGILNMINQYLQVNTINSNNSESYLTSYKGWIVKKSLADQVDAEIGNFSKDPKSNDPNDKERIFRCILNMLEYTAPQSCLYLLRILNDSNNRGKSASDVIDKLNEKMGNLGIKQRLILGQMSLGDRRVRIEPT